jgi:flagellar basal-body rod protein FlgF
LEGSTVQPVKEIANMTELSRAYEQLQSLLSDDNDREAKMIQTLGAPAE